MKKQEYQKYVYLMFAGFGSIALAILFFFLLFKMDTVEYYLKAVVGTLMPFIYGGVMAYLIYPISQGITLYLNKLTEDRYQKKTKAAGVFLGILIFAVTIYLILWMLLPQLVDSIVSIVVGMPAMVDSLTKWIGNILSDNPELKNIAEATIENSSLELESWLSNSIIPKAQELLTSLSASVLSTLWGVFDFVVGIIVCVYILGSSDKLKRQTKMIVKALFPEKLSKGIFEITNEMDVCFGGFIRGKLLDSLIIGIICFACMSLMNMPYTVLVSTIVGITNIIPFFGPFVGAIPSALLILTVNPMQSLYFLIFVFILQQFDGNILGPAILGQSTGLGSIWVLFSILVFGDLFGFVGMIIGVPLFAVIYLLITKFVFKQLKRKNLDAEIEDYRARYPDKRVERDEKELQKSFEKANRLSKVEDWLKKIKKKKNKK